MTSDEQPAQPNQPQSGASNAEDFQPPTGNPQAVPGEVFPDSPNLQTPTTDQLLQNNTLTITVPGNGTGSAPQTTSATPDNGLMFMVAIVLAIGLIIFLWFRNRKQPTSRVVEEPEIVEQPKKVKKRPKKRNQKKSKKRQK